MSSSFSAVSSLMLSSSVDLLAVTGTTIHYNNSNYKDINNNSSSHSSSSSSNNRRLYPGIAAGG